MDDYLDACSHALDRAKNVSLNLEAGTASPNYWPEYAPYFLVSEDTIYVKELALAGKIMEDTFDVAACQKLAGEFYQPGSQPTLP